MATCECGFRFGPAILAGQVIESYAIVHDDDYQRVIDDELAIRSEPKKKRKRALIAKGSKRVGLLYVCPECAALVLLKPQKWRSSDGSFTILRESSGPDASPSLIHIPEPPRPY